METIPSATIGKNVCRKIVNTVSAPAAIGPYNQVLMRVKVKYNLALNIFIDG